MAIFGKFDGIDGDATHDAHKNWVDIDSLQFGVGRAISTPAGSAGNRETSAPSVSEITISRHADKASPLFFKEAVTGAKSKKVQIDMTTTGDPGDTYLTYTLEDVLVSGFSQAANGDRPMETISLNFAKMELKYTPYDKDHKPGSPVITSYDLATAKGG